MNQRGIVADLGDQEFGYFAWPTVALCNGTLMVAASGLRQSHICPWGKSVIFLSHDEGKSWSAPRVINDTPLDDRDCGLVRFGSESLLLSWFSLDVRGLHLEGYPEDYKYDSSWEDAFKNLTGDVCEKWQKSWVRVSHDCGRSWGDFVPVPVSSPHGPVQLRHRIGNEVLLYLGKEYPGRGPNLGKTMAATSQDGGNSWRIISEIPAGDAESCNCLAEPHAVELPSGKIVGHIRGVFPADDERNFHLFQTESLDGGYTWSPARATGIYGSPAHLMCHSSGALICVYSYRKEPFGIRARVSRDEGVTWGEEIILSDDGFDFDLGYPSNVELPGGDLFCVYYQKTGEGRKCALQWLRWGLQDS